MEMGGAFQFWNVKASFQEELTITLALWSRIIVKKVPSKVKNGSTVTDLHVLMVVLHNNQGQEQFCEFEKKFPVRIVYVLVKFIHSNNDTFENKIPHACLMSPNSQTIPVGVVQ